MAIHLGANDNELRSFLCMQFHQPKIKHRRSEAKMADVLLLFALTHITHLCQFFLQKGQKALQHLVDFSLFQIFHNEPNYFSAFLSFLSIKVKKNGTPIYPYVAEQMFFTIPFLLAFFRSIVFRRFVLCAFCSSVSFL